MTALKRGMPDKNGPANGQHLTLASATLTFWKLSEKRVVIASADVRELGPAYPCTASRAVSLRTACGSPGRGGRRFPGESFRGMATHLSRCHSHAVP